MTSNEMQSQIRKTLSRNRTEEIGKDVWDYFVIPPFYQELDLIGATKSRVIIGGRGCGKTMILRFLSHNTVFSKNRKSIDEEALQHIGLYWRTDVQFCNMMHGRGIEDDVWASAFSHLLSVTFAKEILDSLQSIANSNLDAISQSDLGRINFSRLAAINPRLPATFRELDEFLTAELWQFESWVNNARAIKAPFFMNSKFPIHLIDLVKGQLAALEKSVFYVYIDEYENLLSTQQSQINDLIKNSQAPIIYNYAMKRHADENRKTTGQEQISDVHDFRSVDLEELLLRGDGDEFKLFASEILLLELNTGGITNSDIDYSILKDLNKIELRTSVDYRKKVLSAVEKTFPSISQAEMASWALKSRKLSSKLKEQIGEKLNLHDVASLKTEDFFLPDFPEATVILPALLSRKNSPKEIFEELSKLRAGKDNKFTGETAWIHNNFVACFLWLHHISNEKVSVFYSGLEAFCKMSHGNIRHFLELCYKSLLFSPAENAFDKIGLHSEEQALGAWQASESLREEIKSFGTYGLKLYQFVNRLGYLFALDHKKDAQSENERNHFAITRGEASLSSQSDKLLREAEKWSVLIKHISTKKKSYDSPDLDEYSLNPIYAPYFLISYRKKRRVEFRSEEIEVLFNGTLDAYKDKLISKFSTGLGKESKNSVLPLFASMDEVEKNK